jgi:RNA 3'-terminal phosphate cyclase (ATP)
VRCVFSQNREISRLPFGREHTGSYDAGPSGRAEEFSSVLNGNRRNDGDVIATPSIDRFVDLRHSKVRSPGVLEIDGSRYSGSGSIVRQAVAFAALTGTAVHVFNVRVKRPKPGLRRQHAQTIEAVRQLVKGSTAGAVAGAGEFVFCPGTPTSGRNFSWDIGSAGSTTVLALALLPVLAFRPAPVSIDLRGGLFQDFAPSFYHLQYVLLPLLQRMGFEAMVRMERPGRVKYPVARVFGISSLRRRQTPFDRWC